MIKNLAFRGIIVILTCCSATFISQKTAASKKNIILIVADDMGFSDIGCYGSEINTPNIDRLAQEGIRLRQCYNNGICAPSRASILTGQYPHKAGIGYFNRDLGLPAYQGYLNKESRTFAEVFKESGYNTYMCGKWHVGNHPDAWPLKRGFDKFFGFIGGAASFWDDIPITKGSPTSAELIEEDKPFIITAKDHYLTDVLTDRALGYLKGQTNNNPFFLYMAYNSPHWPLHAKPEDIAKYKGKYNLGWDAMRTLRHQKSIQLGLVDSIGVPLRDTTLHTWDKITYEERKVWSKKMDVYAAMVDNLDQNVGRLIKYLEATRQLEQTLIVFISDNGAEEWDLSKMDMTANRTTGPVGSAGSNESYTKYGAQVSTMPFRSYKSTPYEGGLSTPFVVRFPKGDVQPKIQPVIKPGAIQQGAIHITDLLPSFLDWAGIPYTTNKVSKSTPHPLVGESFIPKIKKDQWERTNPICYEWAGHRAVWKGKWKIASTYPKNKWELYDITIDRTESNNLAKGNSVIIDSLATDYKNWAANNEVTKWNKELQDKVDSIGGH
jgi:arylsulfatase A-like enzyme